MKQFLVSFLNVGRTGLIGCFVRWLIGCRLLSDCRPRHGERTARDVTVKHLAVRTCLEVVYNILEDTIQDVLLHD